MTVPNHEPIEGHGFRVYGGSIVGADHQAAFRNSQDAWTIEADKEGTIVGLVCDGCGSTPHAEVGAKLLARVLADRILVSVRLGMDIASSPHIEAIGSSAVSRLRRVVDVIDAKDVVNDYFYATVVGFAITKNWVSVFGCGDGLWSVDVTPGSTRPSSLQVIDQDNRPEYLAQRIVNPESSPRLCLYETYNIVDVKSVIVATDGAVELNRRWDEMLEDGLPIGHVTQFVADSYVQSPWQVQKRLNVIGGRQHKLHDDTTIVAARRV